MDINDFIASNKQLKKLWEDPHWRLVDTNISDISSFRFQKDGTNELKTIVIDKSEATLDKYLSLRKRTKTIQEPVVETEEITAIVGDKPVKSKLVATSLTHIHTKYSRTINDAFYFGKIMDQYLEDPVNQNIEYTEDKIKLAILDSSFAVGGAVWSIVLLLKYLDKSKIYPRVYSGKKSEITEYIKNIGIEVIICPYECTTNPSIFNDWIVEQLNEWKPDVVDGAWSVHWGFDRYRESVPVVVAHGQATEIPWLEPNGRFSYCPYNQNLVDKIDGIICVAQAVQDAYPIIQDKSIVIPSPIDIASFSDSQKYRDPIRGELGLDEDTLTIAWVGRISEQKRPDILLQIVDIISEKIDNFVVLAAAVLPSYFMNQPMSNTWIDGLDNRPIIWIPDMKPYHAPIFYSAADVFLLNSDWEGLSLTSLEALAAGVPVICTDVSGQSEIVKHGENGFLCQKGDVKDLADKIVQFYDLDKDEKSRMSQNARTSVYDVDARKNAQRTLNFYNELLSGKC